MALQKYLSLIKFSHTVFALPFAIIGFLIALQAQNQGFDFKLFILVLLCMVFARSAAMAFNRYIDRKFDSLNPRTRTREIPAGAIKANSALVFVLVNSILFVATSKFINDLCFLSFTCSFINNTWI